MVEIEASQHLRSFGKVYFQTALQCLASHTFQSLWAGTHRGHGLVLLAMTWPEFVMPSGGANC